MGVSSDLILVIKMTASEFEITRKFAADIFNKRNMAYYYNTSK